MKTIKCKNRPGLSFCRRIIPAIAKLARCMACAMRPVGRLRPNKLPAWRFNPLILLVHPAGLEPATF
jgi:hypothetical protein